MSAAATAAEAAAITNFPSAAMDKEAKAVSVNGSNAHSHVHAHHSHHDGFSHMAGATAPSPQGASFNPAAWKPYEHRRLANPAPLGLCAFALTTFVLSAINMHARGLNQPNIVVSLAFAYGGLVQLLAGMWEMVCGNTFGATALSSYGGFWIAYAIILTPAWGITSPTGPYNGNTNNPLALFLTGWFIFTTLLLLCTLKSTVMFFLLFLTLDLAFLFLMIEQYTLANGNTAAGIALQKTGGFFGFLAAFLAWYNALAGIQDSSNSFFQVPVFHFPWSDKGKELRSQKSARAQV